MKLSNFSSLIKGELLKVYKTRGFLCSICLIVIVIVISGIISSNDKLTKTNWKQEIETQITDDSKLIADADKTNQFVVSIIEEIEINKYRLDHDIPPLEGNSSVGFVKKYSGITALISLIIIIFASNMISKEVQWGTLKMILIRPCTKVNLLLSKYFSMLVLGVFLYIITIILLTLTGMFLFGIDTMHFKTLQYVASSVVELNIINELLKHYFFSFILLCAFSALALMISVILNSSSVSIVITLLTFLFGGVISSYFSKYSWSKYLFFTHTDLSSYGLGQTMVTKSDPMFSLVIVAVYIFIFLFVAIFIFNRKELTK